MKIMVTGAAGYIGGTFCWEALKLGHSVLGIDNFINSNKVSIDKIHQKHHNFIFEEIDLAKNEELLKKVINTFKPDAVIHFCGLKAVGESEANPSMYWKNNLLSTLNLLETIDCKKTQLIFSSSATVYGMTEKQPIKENEKLQTTSAYGSTKLAQEILIADYARTKNLKAVLLRYFNPVGSHEDKVIVEDFTQSPNNLMPRLIRVGLGIDKKLFIFGNDYATKDGTGERDYIHISDLVSGHFAALDYEQDIDNLAVFNLGTGSKTSVIELINNFETINNIKINYEFAARREGDVAICYADALKAKNILNWQAKKSISEMCKDAWDAAALLKSV